jgi:hypothetical protein
LFGSEPPERRALAQNRHSAAEDARKSPIAPLPDCRQMQGHLIKSTFWAALDGHQISFDLTAGESDEWSRPNRIIRRRELTNFSIDCSNSVRRAKKAESEDGGFSSEAELFKFTNDWPMARLSEVWNNLPGAVQLTRFKDRKTAIRRIWEAIQGANLAVTTKDADPLRGVASTKPKGPTHEQPIGKGTKTEQIIALLKTPAGATLKSIMAATGWQSHSVRGFVSAQLIKRMGLRVKSIKRAGERVYRIPR